MKHQPYETWIFTQDDLDADQAKELHVHLKLCDGCSALATALLDVENQITSVPERSPAPGFTIRWRERLEKRKQFAYRRQTSVLFAAMSLGSLILLVPLLIQFGLVVLSPESLISDFVKDFVNWLAMIRFAGDVTVEVIDGMLSTIPIVWWLSIATIMVAVFLFWLFTIHRLQLSPRRVNGGGMNNLESAKKE